MVSVADSTPGVYRSDTDAGKLELAHAAVADTSGSDRVRQETGTELAEYTGTNPFTQFTNPNPTINQYAYRHSYITEALERGLTASAVAESVGSSAKTIEKYYDHLDQKKTALKEAALRAVS